MAQKSTLTIREYDTGQFTEIARARVKKGNAECTLVQALRLCTGRTTYRGS